MFKFLINNLLWQDGIYIAIYILILSIILSYFFKFFFIIALPLFLFCLYFFRNPDTKCIERLNDKSILICPADGKVVNIIDGDFEGYAHKISIFLSPLDVHVNWLPDSGKIEKIIYRPGKFIVAYAPKSSDINERNDVIIRCDNGQKILVRQIAGIIARRICCWVKENEVVQAGQKFGMIRFGSRVDILLPSNVSISISVGERVVGGQTVLGRWI